MTWNPLKKPALCQKPALSQGLASYEDDRILELNFVKLQELDENCRKLYKEVRRSEDLLSGLHRAEEKLASDLCNSQLCQDDAELKSLTDKYVSVAYQMGHTTEDLTDLNQRTVVDPLKKLTGEFPHVQAALKRRDQTLAEVLRTKDKLEKQQKLERTGQNIVKTEQMKRCYQAAKEDFEKQNRLLVLELPQFYKKRIEYFNPSLQALIRSQVDYYGENTRLYTNLITGTPNSRMADGNGGEGVEGGGGAGGSQGVDPPGSADPGVADKLAKIKALSIV
ncbi:bridging integrator 3 [Eurytemora carolleeae]|uniref:bridging integrator 3 n=1 Tax=Eurytemora carolleeae TaxID=1294199 RepID=UPI000C77FF3C|nr:bridging integrator 3 [Eurytemora carolleeae]|eukprot:XP_023337520.1 bridging integrator 3-like [Eurytemora affinis]